MVETRGVSNHGFIDSIYFRDPNGVILDATVRLKAVDTSLMVVDTDRVEMVGYFEQAPNRDSRITLLKP